ncbi:hypothetical protein C8R43DRAFT_584170 [Mycena crocata]|nr:hypothetical protein C8R43DRAFT_584170 [Mycena crocata]
MNASSICALPRNRHHTRHLQRIQRLNTSSCCWSRRHDQVRSEGMTSIRSSLAVPKALAGASVRLQARPPDIAPALLNSSAALTLAPRSSRRLPIVLSLLPAHTPTVDVPRSYIRSATCPQCQWKRRLHGDRSLPALPRRRCQRSARVRQRGSGRNSVAHKWLLLPVSRSGLRQTCLGVVPCTVMAMLRVMHNCPPSFVDVS